MQLTEEDTKMAQRSKPKSKTRKSASNTGASQLFEDTLSKLNRLTKDAENTLGKVRRAVKDASQNVASGAGDLASHLPVVGHPKKAKARKTASSSKKRAGSKNGASAGPSAEKKSTASASKKSDSAPKARAARKPAASKSSE
jgi:hypothetical protein